MAYGERFECVYALKVVAQDNMLRLSCIADVIFSVEAEPDDISRT